MRHHGAAPRRSTQPQSWGAANAGVNLADFGKADDSGVFDVVSSLRHRHCSLRHLARSAPGETLDLGLSNWMTWIPLVPFSN